MQIDFHHGVTYVVARLAGFDHDCANIIAYSAQYVDDAINAGLIRFDNGALFTRISSAHKMLDYRNFKELANHYVWIPFHFLPGNGGLPADQDPAGTFVEKLICRPNSYVAQDMVRECINQRHHSYGLYRLGVTMHVYADTWAHQGFAGISHRVNEATYLIDEQGKPDHKIANRLKNFFIGEALPLGHGTVLSNTDKPFLRWGYTNGRGEKIVRDNPKDFLAAADHLCQAMQRYRMGNMDATVPGLEEPDKSRIAELLQTIRDEKGEARHQQWLAAIAEGVFSFGSATVTYTSKGKGSWKYEALKTECEVDRDTAIYPYSPAFLTSHWKLVHDALQAHRFHIVHELLPKYKICIA